MDIFTIIVIVIGLGYSIILHEIAHGWVADRLGDPTARLSGRLTLNPIPHIDPIGTILVPFLMFFSPFHQIFGMAKPVPIDPYNLQNQKKDTMIISLAGPLTNIIIALLLSLSIRVVMLFYANPGNSVFFVYDYLISINITLAIFNLIPIAPLDGEKILVGLLPSKLAHKFDRFMNVFGMYILILIIFPIFGGVPIISPIIGPIINLFRFLLIPSFGSI